MANLSSLRWRRRSLIKSGSRFQTGWQLTQNLSKRLLRRSSEQNPLILNVVFNVVYDILKCVTFHHTRMALLGETIDKHVQKHLEPGKLAEADWKRLICIHEVIDPKESLVQPSTIYATDEQCSGGFFVCISMATSAKNDEAMATKANLVPEAPACTISEGSCKEDHNSSHICRNRATSGASPMQQCWWATLNTAGKPDASARYSTQNSQIPTIIIQVKRPLTKLT